MQRPDVQPSSTAMPVVDEEMVWVSGGTFQMGSDHHYPEEGPTHPEKVQGFWIDRFAVTNEQFARFVSETGYVTLAEIPPRAEDYPGAKPEMLQPASVVFKKRAERPEIPFLYRTGPPKWERF